MEIAYAWRGPFADDEVNALHAEAFQTRVFEASEDTMVAAAAGRRGVGTRLVALATSSAREAGCEWLHVDFDDHLRGFYFEACGFRPTNAGVIELQEHA